MIATLAFALVPVQDSTPEWSLGVLKNPGQYCAVLGFGLLGLLPYRYLCQALAGRQPLCPPPAGGCAGVCLLFSIVHIGIGKFGQWNRQ